VGGRPKNQRGWHYAADSRHEPAMKPRQLLQAMRRARHESITAVSTTCQTSTSILLFLTRRRNGQGLHLSIALLVTCTSLTCRRLPHLPSHTLDAAVTCQRAITATAKHWLF
jgi:hypothetical protein